jgi:hypothetical protein
MAKVTIPIQVSLTRVDGSTVTIDKVKQMDVSLSLDGGATFSVVQAGIPPSTTSVVLDGIDDGSTGIVRATETGTDGVVSAPSATVTFSIPNTPLNAPTLGTPVIG